MRPVRKKIPGENVTYMDSQGEIVNHVIQQDYDPYGEAKMPLVGNLGPYCSYCEGLRETANLAVEHLAARSRGGSETAWENFLLCCNVCNSVKNNTIANDLHWPHVNNTFLSFVYDKAGRVKVNPNIPEVSQRKAQQLLELTHLERYPGETRPSPKDYRWKKRYETWNKAERSKELYQSGCINEDDVINDAKQFGFWSVWFTVFRGIDSILSRLISDFEGTCETSFDATNHYEPIPRNPGCEDPI